MDKTKKLTQASLLSSVFIITTIISVSTGFGYAIYLDFIVPVFFCLVLFKCDIKYTILSGIVSLIIIGLILGNIGTAIWTSQSIILGIMCGYFINKKTTILDDIVYTSILGVIIMVTIDIYFSVLIGYSFMGEFQSFANKFQNEKYISLIYYMFIALFPMGSVFSIYILSLIMGKKLNILKGNAKYKMYIIRNFRGLGRFVCCSKNVYYMAVIYILLAELLKKFGIEITSSHIKTILISAQYLCTYFVIRDSYTAIQNYIISKYRKIIYTRIMSIVVLLSLIYLFKTTTVILVVLNIILNKRINIRVKQIDIVNNYINTMVTK